MKKKPKPWPTPELPPAPETHGDYRNWSDEDKAKFHAWAVGLKDYPPQKETKIDAA